MPEVTLIKDSMPFSFPPASDASIFVDKRHLTAEEIEELKRNGNTCSDPEWKNFWVSNEEGCFSTNQIQHNNFSGTIILGKIRPATIKYHDLVLMSGIYNSVITDLCTGDDCAIQNVNYISNYKIGNRVILFNIQEMSCTSHSKFGEGILKEGENESSRIWIGVGNENEKRAVLAFKDMITADAYIWSRYREDKLLMMKFIEFTEKGNSKEHNTFGFVDDDTVIKNCTLLKDVQIGKNAYIKGAFKLKNMTVLSSPDEPSQIGEGVEMVNGIMGYKSHVFYQAVAVRFVIGRNCQLKYGARLLNSVLGDNSTVSCCELLNNLIFPFHEQHHNSSFLIASTLMGQSNIASAATIGSNHNSRSPDCEMIAGRGFWPGLCSDFKFDSKFASFVLVSKGSYKYELNIDYPYSLVAQTDGDNAIHIIPAYWFLYNMFAIVRNKTKYLSRDKRVTKVQHIETDPLAPDSMQEILISLDRIIELTGRYLKLDDEKIKKMTQTNPNPKVLEEYRIKAQNAQDEKELYSIAKNYLEISEESKFILTDDRCQKKYGALIFKPAQAYHEYRKILKYFSVECLMAYVNHKNRETFLQSDIEDIEKAGLFTEWLNVGGQIIPEMKINDMFNKIKKGEINSWQEIHDYYDSCERNYFYYKARYSLYLIEQVYGKSMKCFTKDDYSNLSTDVAAISMDMLESAINAREKDYNDFFRSITFRNSEEKEAVLGSIKDNLFLQNLKHSTEEWTSSLEKLFASMC